MFTGLVEEIGVIKSVEQSGGGLYLTVGAAKVIEGTHVGDSINIDGACQTVTGTAPGSFTVFCSRVSAELTTLGKARAGRRVNLERAMSMQSRFGGHMVQGHVDGRGVIQRVNRDENGVSIDISAPGDILRYVVPRGSIAVDGISLTVVSTSASGFSLYLIPETTAATTLNEKKQGQEVNLEADIFAKYIEHLMNGRNAASEPGSDASLKKKLLEEGFF